MSGDSGIDDRITRCEVALYEGTKFKVHDGNFAPSLAIFQDAYDEAIAEPRLPKPWPQIAAYRLAHIRLRTARSYEEFEEVEELFQEAGRLGVEVLGPVPSIYRLAALQRMIDLASNKLQAESCREARARLFENLAKSAHRHAWDFSASSRQAVVQGTLHNYLELASYFTGEPYDLISGMASPMSDMMLDDDWLVVGTGGVGRERFVRLGSAMARVELESRAERGETDLMFELGDISVRESGFVWAHGQEPVKVPLRSLLLLLEYCRSPQASSVELERSVIPAGDEGGTRLKDIADNLRKGLGRYAEFNGVRVIQPGSRTEPARLNPDVRVVGMVHQAKISGGPPPLGRYETKSHQ